jgi:dihydrolipoamide dehydrogenase
MSDFSCDVVVLGSGPGGYSAAFRAADLGMKVMLVEYYAALGGVCLNVGCIPSKALLHMAEVLQSAKSMKAHGIDFGTPKIDIKKIKAHKEGIVGKLNAGLAGMAKRRKVEVVHGFGVFQDANTIVVDTGSAKKTIAFKQAIVAVGSKPVKLPFLPESDRIYDSTGALELNHTKGKMLVLGGGIIGCEMATVYRALGCEVMVVELMDQIMPGMDKDLVRICQKHMESDGITFALKTKVVSVEAKKDHLMVSFEGASATDKPLRFDHMLSSVGRKPSGHTVAAEAAGISVDERGFMPVNERMQTNLDHIYAIGDVALNPVLAGNPLLAHKAVSEGRVAAEIIAGETDRYDALCIPSVAYTDPEVATVGLTEKELKEKDIPYKKGAFPWAASGRALCNGRSEGMTKILSHAKTHKILGAGIVGPHAGELIAELALAIEMGCDVADVALTIHAHPTLSESVMIACELIEGTSTDL